MTRYCEECGCDVAERATGIDLDEGLVDKRLVAAWRKS